MKEKLVYIGHSYHSKTKSTAFLIDILKEYFDVEVILDNSWQGESFPDLSFIDETYKAVVFFQVFPPLSEIEKVKHVNIIHFPMYDQAGLMSYTDWLPYREMKFINFSRTLHDKMTKFGLNTIYVQFFPKPEEFTPGDKARVFFWQRVNSISIDQVRKLLEAEDIKLHMHKAVDPGNQFVSPSLEEEQKFNITYSEWFETRQEMKSLMKQKGVYIAPRVFEGIGMSFLEAMAMGKAVISVDNPTMNEYITNNYNGYLFDLNKLSKIDLSNIEQVQLNAYQYMQRGYDKWQKEDIPKIIDYISLNQKIDLPINYFRVSKSFPGRFLKFLFQVHWNKKRKCIKLLGLYLYNYNVQKGK